MVATRFPSLEEKTRRVMQELNLDWHAARRELSRRSTLVRRWKMARKKGVEAPFPIKPYQGPKLILTPVNRPEETKGESV